MASAGKSILKERPRVPDLEYHRVFAAAFKGKHPRDSDGKPKFPCMEETKLKSS
jgi:hypothetical protein